MLSQQTERKIGEAIYRDIQRDPEFLDDTEVNEYLNLLGAKLVAAGPGSPWVYMFFAMRDAGINAFALPGGYVGVNTGLIRLTENESELASVLAHEVSHVTQRHIARMIGGQQQAQIPAMIGLAAAILLANSRPDLASAAAAVSQAGVMQDQLNYTRDFEREADRVGFQRLSAAGFDVSAMGVFFEKLQRTTRVADDGSVPGYLRSHPVTTERIAEAQSRAAGIPYRQSLDSTDYLLVRAKLRVEASDARDAVAFFSDALRDQRYASEAATRYGLALALLKGARKDQAAQEMLKLRATGVSGPMIESLAARIQDARGDREAAIATLRSAISRYPARRAVLYDFLRLLLDDRQYDAAGAVLAERLRGAPRDAKLQAFQARVYQAQGRNLLHHQAQAEAYYLEGALPAAIEQLEIALKAGDGDFYQLSAAEARLKLMRAEREQEARQSKRP